MTSQALDLVTMGHALNELSTTYLGDCQWRGTNVNQQLFLDWYARHRDEISSLTGLEALASTKHVDLNSFLENRGFEPMFQELNGVGVVSILDMLVEWPHKGVPTTIRHYDGSSRDVKNYPAFSIAADGVEVFDLASLNHPLVRLHTTTGHSLWLIKAIKPLSGFELALNAQAIAGTPRTISSRWTLGVKVPMLEMDIQPDLSWMLGVSTVSPNDGYHQIVQAFQQFKLRANAEGARVRVATGFATMRGGPVHPIPYEFSEPFIRFFTQPGHDELPLAAFWADTDSWRNPKGTLEEL